MLNKGRRSSRSGLKITGLQLPGIGPPLSHLQPSPPSPARRTHRRLPVRVGISSPRKQSPPLPEAWPQHVSFRIPEGGSFRWAVPPTLSRVLLPRVSPLSGREGELRPSLPVREGWKGCVGRGRGLGASLNSVPNLYWALNESSSPSSCAKHWPRRALYMSPMVEIQVFFLARGTRLPFCSLCGHLGRIC